MTAGQLLAKVLAEAGLDHADERVDTERVAEAFLRAVHMREERAVVGAAEPTMEDVEAAIRATLAPTK